MPYYDMPGMEGFDPDDGNPLSFNKLGWFIDGGDLSSITDAGSGAVSQWNDLSRNANHMVQGIGASRPTTGTNTLNGRNVVDFDGSNDWMDGSYYNFDITHRCVTYFAVLKWDAAGTGKCPFYAIRSGLSPYYHGFQIENNGSFGYSLWYGKSNSSTSATEGVAYTLPGVGTTDYCKIVVSLDYGLGLRLFVNGTLILSPTVVYGTMADSDFMTTSQSPWLPTIGRRPDPFYFDGKIATMGLIETALSNNDLQRLDKWLYRRWGV